MRGSVDDELLILASYVNSSTYRKGVMDSLNNFDVKIPKQLAFDAGIRINHVSKVLSELKSKGLIVCINPSAHKGRLYRLTPLGVDVKDILDKLF